MNHKRLKLLFLGSIIVTGTAPTLVLAQAEPQPPAPVFGPNLPPSTDTTNPSQIESTGTPSESGERERTRSGTRGGDGSKTRSGKRSGSRRPN